MKGLLRTVSSWLLRSLILCQKIFNPVSPFSWFVSNSLRYLDSRGCLALIDLQGYSLLNNFSIIYSSLMLDVFSYLADIFDGTSVKLEGS